MQLDVPLTPPRVLRFRRMIFLTVKYEYLLTQRFISGVLETFRTEDFDIQYGSVNRFRFMGNGMTLSQERVYY